MTDNNSPEESELETAEEENGGEEQASETVDLSDDAEEEAETEPDTIESLQAKLADAELGVKDAALRAQAEIQNIRRRTERDVANAHKFGQEKLVKDLFAIVDSLEMGINTIDEQNKDSELPEQVKSIRDGSELTLKMFHDVLSKHNIVAIDPMGEPFNPEFHQAMSMVENPDAEPNSVIAVMQKGYTLNDRVIRPAMVMVAKEAAK